MLLSSDRGADVVTSARASLTPGSPSRERDGVARLAPRSVTLAAALVLGSVVIADSTPPIVAAVKAGNSVAVQSLIKQRVDVNAPEADGTTALHWAARADDVDMVRTLLRAGGNAKLANRYGVTALQLAAVNGSAPVITRLVAAGADVNAVLPEGETILMTAARTGRPEALEILLGAGAHVNAVEKWHGETALHWAAAENHGDAVRLLASRGADVDVRSATQTYRRRSGQSILPLGSWTPLMYAARGNAIEAGRALASLGAKLDLVDPDGATALVIAIINAHYDFAAMLLDAGADPNVADKDAGMGPLYATADMHRLAVGHGRPNPKPSGALDAVELTRRLLEKKADPNAKLKAAIIQRQHTIGDATLAAGATPLMRAAKSGDAAIVRLLLDAGADPAATLANGNNALLFASGLGWRDGSPAAPSYDQGSAEEAVATIDLLLARGLDINATNNTGDTPLHAAVSGRASPEIVRALVARGARLDVQNKRGQTPLMLAKNRGNRDMSAILTILQAAASK
ncbi:MAG TPA: ankyrin repeat domain-containing protein [Vicinamibacterales bacterium]|nr:ankyrin repeat domain-containing protein [Vicinamibacterales bacterium]